MNRSRSPPKNRQQKGKAPGVTFPFGIDQNTLTEAEINKLLEITSEKSLKQIARETERMAGENMHGSNMVKGDMKITLQEIEDFMKEISQFKAHKVTKKELR